MLEVSAFPFRDNTRITRKKVAGLASVWEAEHLPECGLIVNHREVTVKDAAWWDSRRSLIVYPVRNDVRIIARDIVVISHLAEVCVSPMFGLLYWIIVELCGVIEGDELDFLEEARGVNVPFLYICWFALLVSTITAINGITFEVVRSRDNVRIRVMKSSINLHLFAGCAIVPDMTIDAIFLIDITFVDVVLDACLTLHSITCAQCCPCLRQMWSFWICASHEDAKSKDDGFHDVLQL